MSFHTNLILRFGKCYKQALGKFDTNIYEKKNKKQTNVRVKFAEEILVYIPK